MAAITGLDNSSKPLNARFSCASFFSTTLSLTSANSPTSEPAQNALSPAPAMTTARTSPSPSNSSSARINCSDIPRVTRLSGGLFNVSLATPSPSGSVRTDRLPSGLDKIEVPGQPQREVGEVDYRGEDHEGHNAGGYRLDLAASPKDGVGLLSARPGQPGLCDDAPDLLPLCLRDALQRGTHVGLVDSPQDSQRLLHPVVPVEERLRVGRLHHGVDLLRHPAGSLEVATVHGLEHLHVQIGYEATVPGENTVGADAQGG